MAELRRKGRRAGWLSGLISLYSNSTRREKRIEREIRGIIRREKRTERERRDRGRRSVS